MTLIKNNTSNGNSDSVELRKKMVEAEKAEKDNEMKTFQKTVDNLSESIEECTDAIKEFIDKQKNPEPQEYFDKNLSSSVEKAVSLLQKLKQPTPNINIDLSPINSIAIEIKKGNDNIISLLNRPNQSDEVVRMLSAMVGKQNITFEKLVKEIDYTPQLNGIIEALNKKDNDKVEKLSVVYGQYGAIKEVIPIYKNK